MNKISGDELLDLLEQYGERDEDADLKLKEFSDARSLRDAGFDSLGIFNVIVQISVKYGSDVPYDQAADADTFSDLLMVINRALDENA